MVALAEGPRGRGWGRRRSRRRWRTRDVDSVGRLTARAPALHVEHVVQRHTVVGGDARTVVSGEHRVLLRNAAVASERLRAPGAAESPAPAARVHKLQVHAKHQYRHAAQQAYDAAGRTARGTPTTAPTAAVTVIANAHTPLISLPAPVYVESSMWYLQVHALPQEPSGRQRR
jgi:hypothetical protein